MSRQNFSVAKPPQSEGHLSDRPLVRLVDGFATPRAVTARRLARLAGRTKPCDLRRSDCGAKWPTCIIGEPEPAYEHPRFVGGRHQFGRDGIEHQLGSSKHSKPC